MSVQKSVVFKNRQQIHCKYRQMMRSTDFFGAIESVKTILCVTLCFFGGYAIVKVVQLFIDV